MKKKFLVGLFVLAIGVFAFVFYLGLNNNSSVISGNTVLENISVKDTSAGTIPLASSSGISQEDLAKHDSRDDCWVAYKGKVYDISDWLPSHPGGINKILLYCGSATEFEQAFTRQHGTSKALMLMRVGVFMGDFTEQGNLK